MVQTEKNTMFHRKKVIYSDESRILTSKVPGKLKSTMIFGAIWSNGLRFLEKSQRKHER